MNSSMSCLISQDVNLNQNEMPYLTCYPELRSKMTKFPAADGEVRQDCHKVLGRSHTAQPPEGPGDCSAGTFPWKLK